MNYRMNLTVSALVHALLLVNLMTSSVRAVTDLMESTTEDMTTEDMSTTQGMANGMSTAGPTTSRPTVDGGAGGGVSQGMSTAPHSADTKTHAPTSKASVEDSTASVTPGDSGDDSHTTQDSADDTNGTMTQGPTVTVSHCYSCENSSTCKDARLSSHEKCISDDDICWMSFDVSTGEAGRSCAPLGSTTLTCTDEHPSGAGANNVCQYCCNGDKCNDNVLTKEECDKILDSAAPRNLGLPSLFMFAIMSVKFI